MDSLLYLSLTKAYHAQKNRLRPGLPAIGLSPGQPKILKHLLEQDRCMQKELAEECGIQPATVSRLIDNMEQEGLVVRGGTDERRRAACISITGAGRAAFERWRQWCAEVEKESLRDFSEEEKAQFAAYLGRMYHNLTGKTL